MTTTIKKKEYERMWKVKAKVVPVVAGCDSYAGRVAPPDPRNNIRTVCPDECSPRINCAETLNSQVSGRGPEVEEGTQYPQR